MRIIAGKWGGRRIASPAGQLTRPTSDRMRESLFSSLHSRIGSFEGLRVLDAFAGSGSLGFEALSRGADALVALESNHKASRVIRDNYENLAGDAGSDATFRLLQGDIFKLSAGLENLAIDLAFFDPPYDMSDDKINALLLRLGELKVFALGALIVVERAKSKEQQEFIPDNYVYLDTKTKGDTSLHFISFRGSMHGSS